QPAYALACGEEIDKKTSIVLTADFGPCSGIAINFAPGAVGSTLRLNGHKILGGSPGVHIGAAGVSGLGPGGVDGGIGVVFGSFVTISQVTINGGGISVQSGGGIQLVGNQLNAGGIFIDRSNDARLTGNVINGVITTGDLDAAIRAASVGTLVLTRN